MQLAGQGTKPLPLRADSHAQTAARRSAGETAVAAAHKGCLTSGQGPAVLGTEMLIMHS